jgi:hypothetical protein
MGQHQPAVGNGGSGARRAATMTDETAYREFKGSGGMGTSGANEEGPRKSDDRPQLRWVIRGFASSLITVPTVTYIASRIR